MSKNEMPKIKYQKIESQNIKWQKVNIKKVESNHRPPALTRKLLGKKNNQTRNMKHVNFVPKNLQKGNLRIIIKVVLKIKWNQFHVLSKNAYYHIKFENNLRKRFCKIFALHFSTQKCPLSHFEQNMNSLWIQNSYRKT